MDRIIIRDLRARCIIGINEEERLEEQDVVINLAISLDLRRAGKSDRLEDSLDYSELKKRIMAMVEKSSFFLVEALAEAIANICLEHSMVEQVQVSLDKPSALRFARSVGVEIVRGGEKV